MIHEMIRLVFWTLVLFLALSFFGISIKAIVDSPMGQANLTYLLNVLSQVWLWATYWIRPSV